MIKITVSPMDDYLGRLYGNLKQVGEKVLPNTAKAFEYAATKLLYMTWHDFASGKSVKGIPVQLKNPTGGYARSIQFKKISPFDWEVFSNAKVAEYLEHGTDKVDFKETHTRGKKSRVAYKKDKDGKVRKVGYLIIPFRHKIPGSRGAAMSEIVYKMIRALIKKGEFQKSVVTGGVQYDKNYQGELIPRRTYDWGSRLTGLKDEFANLEGMTAFDTGTSKAARSTYFTFRVISMDSPPGSWIKPATPALNITTAVAAATKKDVEDLIQYGLKKDLGV